MNERKTSTTKRALATGALALSLAVAAPTTALAADIKVGSAGGITGPIAELVAPIINGRVLAAAHVNEQGGLLGGDMYKLVHADSQCDPKAAVDAGQKLVNIEQVVAIVGPSCSGATNAMVQSVTIPAGVAVLSDSATAPAITELEDNDLVFRVSASDAYQGKSLAQYVRDEGFTRVAITYANDDYNAGLAKVFEKEFKALGGTITGSQLHEPDKASYRSELSTLSGNGNPEALALFAYYGSSGITILRNSLENGLFGKFYIADGMLDDSVIEQLGADALRDNIWATRPVSVETPSFDMFADAFRGVGQDPDAPFTAHGYDVAFLMALAIEHAGAPDRGKIAASLREVANAPGEVIRPGEWAKAKKLIAAGTDINYEGATGTIEFDRMGDVPGIHSLNAVGDDGTWTRIK